MVVSVLARGGCERQLLATTRGLLQRGYIVEIFKLDFGPTGDSSFEAEFAALPIKISCAGEFGDMRAPAPNDCDPHGLARFSPILEHLNVVQLGIALETVVRRFRPDVVHCWSEPSSVIGGLVAASLGVTKVVIQIVNVSPDRRNQPGQIFYREAYRLLLARQNVRVLNISDGNARNFERWVDLPSGTIKLLRNGFMPDCMRIRTKREAASYRLQLGMRPDAPVVGAIMRFAPEKDPDLWLQTASLIANERPDVCFVLAGYGPLAEQVESRLKQLDFSRRVVMLGAQIDVGALYACMDVFLMTSHYEGTPNVLIEAQAAGVAVVAPDVGGISETVEDGRTGIVVAERTSAQLAKAVLRILSDPALRRRALKQGPKLVAKRFNWRRKINQTIRYYEEPSQLPLTNNPDRQARESA